MRDKWDEYDEWKMSRMTRDVRRLLEHLPSRFYDRALLEVRTIESARIAEGKDWTGALARLRRIVGEWDRSRPPLLECPECELEVRGRNRLANHRLVVHGLEEA